MLLHWLIPEHCPAPCLRCCGWYARSCAVSSGVAVAGMAGEICSSGIRWRIAVLTESCVDGRRHRPGISIIDLVRSGRQAFRIEKTPSDQPGAGVAKQLCSSCLQSQDGRRGGTPDAGRCSGNRLFARDGIHRTVVNSRIAQTDTGKPTLRDSLQAPRAATATAEPACGSAADHESGCSGELADRRLEPASDCPPAM